MNMPSQFIKILKELLEDNVSNDLIESAILRFPFELYLIRNEFQLNIDFLLILIQHAIVLKQNGQPAINEEILHYRAKLMQKFTIQDDTYSIECLAQIIEILYKKNLLFKEIDKTINILKFENVLPFYICNHWTSANKPNGQPADTLDRLEIIRNCLSFKYSLTCDIDPNEYYELID